MYRGHDRIKRSVLSADEKDPLIQKNKCGLTGTHLAMKEEKHERAVILVKVSECMTCMQVKQPFLSHLEHCRQKKKEQFLLQINHTHCVRPAYPYINLLFRSLILCGHCFSRSLSSF